MNLLYNAARNDWAGRFGFSYSVTPSGSTLLRGAYGTFYDGLFDNLWQNIRNNDFVLPTAFPITSSSTNYLAPPASVVGNYQGQPVSVIFPNPVTQSARAPLTMFQPNFRTPYVQSYFFGLQQQLGRGWTFEANALGSLGRKLLTTDIVNRADTGSLGPISYRGNQGISDYNAATALHFAGGWDAYNFRPRTPGATRSTTRVSLCRTTTSTCNRRL